MNYKSALFIGLIAACPTLHGLVNLGEGQIDLSISSSLEYDSEIRSRELGQSDTLFTFRPSLVYSRPSRNFSLSASVGVIMQRYFDYDEFDEDNFFFDLNVSPNANVEKSRFTFTGDILLNTETASNEQVGDIVTTQNYGVSGELTYHPNRKYSVVGDAHWNKSDPDSDVYNTIERKGAGIRGLVPVKESVFWFAGTTFETVESDQVTRNDSEIWTYLTGITGVLLPKVQGSLSAGIQDRSFDEGGSTSSPYFSAGLTWTADELTTVSLNASTDLGTTINNLASESKNVSLGFRRQLNRELSISGSIGYSITEYTIAQIANREDESFMAGLDISYRITSWGSLSLFTRYSDQSSDSAIFDYDRNRTGIRFTGRW